MRAAVLGRPVGHSLSPVLHNAAYRVLGLTGWQYDAIDCAEADLAGLLTGSVPGEWAGFSCTMPLKRVALELADEADPLAIAIGAANTLLPRPQGGWRAAMTDVAGITGAVDSAGIALAPSTRVTILGAGGTAQAAVGALAERGVDGCTVLVRDLARAGDLTETGRRLGVAVSLAPLVSNAAALAADLVISTLPAHAADAISERDWRSDQAVLDAVYHPWPTALATAAGEAGAVVISGASMLLHQAARQVRLMTGLEPPVEAMRAALQAAAPGCGV